MSWALIGLLDQKLFYLFNDHGTPTEWAQITLDFKHLILIGFNKKLFEIN